MKSTQLWNRGISLLKAILILPGLTLVLVPSLIIYLTGSFNPLCGLEFPLAWIPLIIGGLIFLTGFVISLWTVSLFFIAGEGTPAPWDPPKRFVAQGPYAYVRNPMLLSVLIMILATAILAGSWFVFAWSLIFGLLNTAYFIFFEEPQLKKRFGAEYAVYKENVHRWLPRVRPWKSGGGN